jgi:hypothetical protein
MINCARRWRTGIECAGGLTCTALRGRRQRRVRTSCGRRCSGSSAHSTACNVCKAHRQIRNDTTTLLLPLPLPLLVDHAAASSQLAGRLEHGSEGSRQSTYHGREAAHPPLRTAGSDRRTRAGTSRSRSRLRKPKTPVVLSALSRCLSRACLGRIIVVLSIKWHRKNGRVCLPPAGRLQSALQNARDSL